MMLKPEEIHTRADLVAALVVLRDQDGRSYQQLAERAGLGTATLHDAVSGKTFPRWQTLRLFLLACGRTDIGAWHHAHRRVASDEASTSIKGLLVRNANARHLGVHETIHIDGVDPDSLPAYALRDVDLEEQKGVRALIRTAARQGGFVLLVGGSSVGKTRCLYEAIRELVPNWQLIHPDSATDVAEIALNPPAMAVVWLDELQLYLDGEDGLTAATVRALLQAPAPVLIGATLWPSYHSAYVTPPAPGSADPYARERQLLKLAQVIHIPEAATDTEMQRIRVLAATDARIRAALDFRGYGFTQAMAAAPQLVARWQDAKSNAYAWAVLAAAADAARVGVRTLLSAALLRAAAPGYCNDAERATAPVDWFEQGLAYATTRVHGAISPLTPVAPHGATMGEIAGYTVADYLLEYAGVERRITQVPATLWKACVENLTDANDVWRVGRSAEDRWLFAYAIPLLRRTVHAESASRILQRRPLETAAAAHTKASWAPDAHLAKELLRSRAYIINPGLAFELVNQFVKAGMEEAAIPILRGMAEAGNHVAAIGWADLLASMGQEEEAIPVIRWHAERGDPWAQIRLIRLLSRTEREESLRERATLGDDSAAVELADLLTRSGRIDEAIGTLRSAANAGYPAAEVRLVDLLVRAKREEELRTRTAAGDKYIGERLVTLLLQIAYQEEANKVWQFGLNADGSIASRLDVPNL